jgi:FKBP-type peptidyl-prolyl cis-trans isomerase
MKCVVLLLLLIYVHVNVEAQQHQQPGVRLHMTRSVPCNDYERLAVGDHVAIEVEGFRAGKAKPFLPLTRLQFEIGQQYLVIGLHRGLMGMCIGEKGRIEVPAEHGFGKYGDAKFGVKPYENLEFFVHVLDVAGKANGSQLSMKNEQIAWQALFGVIAACILGVAFIRLYKVARHQSQFNTPAQATKGKRKN